VLRIDHVVRAVADLDVAAARLLDEHGLRTVDGGLHPGWGTGNRIAPLGGGCYLELLAVVDPTIAATTALGRAIAERAAEADGWFAVCLGDDDIDATASRLGLAVVPGSRTLPDGRLVAWRGAGIDDPTRTRDLPFFIEWNVPDDLHPGAVAIDHPTGANGIARVDVAGSPERFASWVGDAALPIRVVSGEPLVRTVVLATPDGELEIA
jgi:Glyoxalase-like domain